MAKIHVSSYATKQNPHFNPKANARQLIDETKKGEIGFWENAWKRMSGSASWIWGVILGDFNDGASVEQIIANTTLTMIQVVDQAADIRDLSANIMTLLDEKERDKTETAKMVIYILKRLLKDGDCLGDSDSESKMILVNIDFLS